MTAKIVVLFVPLVLLMAAPGPIRVIDAIQQAKLLTKVFPQYPSEAREKGIQGTVKLQAIINTDGTVKEVKLLSGPAKLVEASVDAVKQWVYRQTLLNGEPVEVITDINLSYPPAPMRIRVGSSVREARLLTKVEPVYPPEAKANGFEGTVKLRVMIDKDGTVKDIKLVSGSLEFVDSSITAVKQWVYRPAQIGGEPVQVITDIHVDYTLPK